MKLGFLLSQYGENDLAIAFIRNANAFLEKSRGVDIIGFVANHAKAKSHPSFATMNVNEAYDYNAIVVATTIALAEKAQNFPGPRQIIFYPWELNWKGRTFEELIALFHNPRITLVTRTTEHKQVIEKCWNREVKAVIPDCDVEAFVEMVRKNAS